jgi:hypothetical protein
VSHNSPLAFLLKVPLLLAAAEVVAAADAPAGAGPPALQQKNTSAVGAMHCTSQHITRDV